MSTAKKTDENDSEVLLRALHREREARQKAEDLLETMSAEVFEVNETLREQNLNLIEKKNEIEYIQKIALIAEEEIKMVDALKQCLDLSLDLLGWPLGHVFVSKKENPRILESSKIWGGSESNRFEEFKKVSESISFAPGEGLPGRVALEKKVVWVDNLLADENFLRRKLLPDFHFKTGFGVPLAINGQVFAVLEFFHTTKAPNDPKRAEVIFTGVMQMARLLERKRAQRQLTNNFKKLKSTQEQLLQSEKMASLGVIVAGVAHEINNPLSFVLANSETLTDYFKTITGYIELLEGFVENPKEADLSKLSRYDEEEKVGFILTDTRNLIEESLGGLFRVRDIVKGLKSFSHMDNRQKEKFNINDCIETTTRLLANELKYRCDVELRLSSLPDLEGYPGQIVQVFTNLVLNAVQAVRLQRGRICISTSANSNGQVEVCVEDNGSGIAPENLSKIFTPFFSTKPVGSGTGLGLSISYGIVQAHGGNISVSSRLGEGTRFLIQIPFQSADPVDNKDFEEEAEW